MTCEAHSYGFPCSSSIYVYTVLFKSGDTVLESMKANKDDQNAWCGAQHVEVSMCNLHYNYLYKKGINLNENTGLFEIQGKVVFDGLKDLFQPLINTSSDQFTLLRVEYCEPENGDDTWFLIKDTNVDKFRKFLIIEEDKPVRIREVALFIFDGENVIELTEPYSDIDLEEIAKNLTVFFSPVEDFSHMSTAIPPEITAYFEQKLLNKHIEYFEECLDFINTEIDHMIGFNYSRTMSDRYLFDSFRLLTHALIHNDESIIHEMKENGQLTHEVLWFTYVYGNHEFYFDSQPRKNIRNNTRIIDLFIDFNLEHDLLVLAISGERVRETNRHIRSNHNILRENETVVKYLVPDYISPQDYLRVCQSDANEKKVTALQYWHDFSNETYDICDVQYNHPFTFDKNQNIRFYLESFLKN